MKEQITSPVTNLEASQKISKEFYPQDPKRLYKILFSITILVIILGVSFYFLKDRSKVNIGTPPKLRSYNFDYSDGESPWNDHIKTDINTTFETALNDNQYLQTLKCTGDSTDLEKNPFGPVEAKCLEGNSAKMIVPKSRNDISYYIFSSPTKGGLFEQAHMTNGVPSRFFNKDRYNTKFFVIPFNGYEVPTYSPTESKNYLSIWKQIFQKSNEVSDDYFNNHIFVVGTAVDTLNIDGKVEKRFLVSYYYAVDWIYIKLTDNFTYSLEGVGDEISFEELQHDISLPTDQTKYKQKFNFNKLKPIASIATKEQVKNAIKNASPILGFNINGHVVLERNGELAIRLYGIADEAANKCQSGTIILENAVVLEVFDSACRIYN